MDSVILLFFLFVTKHYLVDFLLQTPYMYMNKGNLSHPGGWIHAGLHGISSFWILILWGLGIFPALLISLVEHFAHLFIDAGKVWINNKNGYKCNESSEFWILLGLDQYFHYVTYVLMVLYAVPN